jgi:ADP-ribose pyrophosphatase
VNTFFILFDRRGYMPFTLIKSETLVKTRPFDIRRDRVELPDGKSATLVIVDHPGAVTLLPVDSQGRVWFVRQYRHAIQEDLLELPAGTLEKGEDPEACARREVREETGMAAESLRKIGEFFLAPGYSSEFMRVYLATGLTPAPLQGDDDEFISVERIPLEQVFAMVERGQIKDAKTLAALQLARPYLSK